MDHIELLLHEQDATGPRLILGKQLLININGKPLIDLVRTIELPFAEQEGNPDMAGGYAWISPLECELLDPQETEVRLLGCTCGEIDCWPLMATVERTQDTVRVHSFLNPYRTASHIEWVPKDVAHKAVEWNYAAMGEWRFDAKQFENALNMIQPELEVLRAKLIKYRAEQDIEWQKRIAASVEKYGECDD